MRPALMTDFMEIGTRLADMCKVQEAMSAHELGFGQILFPDEPRDGIFNLNVNPQIVDTAKGDPGYSGQFLVVACVTYGSTISKDRYHTAKGFHLWKQSGPIALDGEAIPPEQLGFVQNPTIGSTSAK
jgi:hypothetical protein